MTAWIRQLRQEEKGITLIELLAVIVIIGVIAAIAVPLITGVINDTKVNARSATANQLFEAAKLRSIAQNNGVVKGTHTLGQLVTDQYIQGGLTDPKTGNALADTTQVNLDNMNSTTATVVTIVISGGETINYTAGQLKVGARGTAPATAPTTAPTTTNP